MKAFVFYMILMSSMIVEPLRIYRKSFPGSIHYIVKKRILLPDKNQIDEHLNIFYTMTIFDRVVQVQIIHYDNYIYFRPIEHLISIFGSSTKTVCCRSKLIGCPSISSFFCELDSDCLLESGEQILVVFDQRSNRLIYMKPYESPTFQQRYKLKMMDGYYGFVAPLKHRPCPEPITRKLGILSIKKSKAYHYPKKIVCTR